MIDIIRDRACFETFLTPERGGSHVTAFDSLAVIRGDQLPIFT
jgi:hypothetical protein